MSKDVFKDQAQKLHERVQVMSQRYQNLERRRQLEMEGYRTDISVLRKKLKEVERQLLKVHSYINCDNNASHHSVNIFPFEFVE